eukprot:Phypoly_transcript_06730.p1 GENE.Phypoly_transcript_06730~~Phypoly_transcript_06730.p1  ORF type:complete len:261 (-),score=79.16 Phypoly_transcript_06730:116-898(-)
MLGEGINRLSTAARNVAYSSASAAQAAANKITERGLMNEVSDISYKGWDLLGTVYQKAKEQIIGAEGNESQSISGYGGGGSGFGYNNSSSSSSLNAISWDDPRSPSSPPSSSSSSRSSSRNKEPEFDDWLDEKPKSSVRRSNDGERSEHRERPDRERSERGRKEKPAENILKASDEGSWEGWGDEVVPAKKEEPKRKERRVKEVKEEVKEKEVKEDDGDDWVWQEENTPKKSTTARKSASTTAPKKTAVPTGGDSWDGWD